MTEKKVTYCRPANNQIAVVTADEYDDLYESVGDYATQWFATALAIIKRLRACKSLVQYRDVIRQIAELPNGSWDLPLESFIKEARQCCERPEAIT